MSYAEKFRNFVSESKRVLRVTKKPDKEEYKTIMKVSAIGIALVGLIGFLLHMVNEMGNRWFGGSAGILIVAVIVIGVVLALLFFKR